ncbi:hypothetical protein TRFO_40293 [Tritrichomonas foetus]|uniref:Uncharacterized protein n=1 Tax=Tritrichomonas foetus TaxID=1144522 RepID=A0A1J4J1L7_9EUKA|nr:hypothetical protein TRFO_40293 [Tritrichomonas foetus]|eukprot:OHS93438.1 hypothetical protein TRFO_40293 [Tritrichomonas foetus]
MDSISFGSSIPNGIQLPFTNTKEFDEFNGSFSKRTVTYDNVKYTQNTLDQILQRFQIVLNNDATIFDTEMKKKIMRETINAIENSKSSIYNFVRFKGFPQMKLSIFDAPTDEIIFGMFLEYIESALKVYNNKLFFTPSIFPFIIFFTNLCCVYIDYLSNPSTKYVLKDFQNAWRDNYLITLRLPYILKETNIEHQFNQLESSLGFHMFDNNQQEDKKISNFLYSLKSVRTDLGIFGKEEITLALVQNTINDYEIMKENYQSLKNIMTGDDRSSKSQFSSNIQALQGFLGTLETFHSVLIMIDMIKRLNQFIYCDSFNLPANTDKTIFTDYQCFSHSLEALNLNFKVLDHIKTIMNKNDPATIECYKTIKQILSDIKAHDERNLDNNVMVIIDIIHTSTKMKNPELFAQFFEFYNEQINILKQNTDDKVKSYINKVIHCYEVFNNFFKNYSNTLIGATNRFSSLANFEDCYRVAVVNRISSVQLNEQLFHIKHYLVSTVIQHSNNLLVRNLRDSYHPLRGRCIEQSEKYIFNSLKNEFETILSKINYISTEKIYSKEAEIFIDFFKLFLQVSLFALNLEESFNNNLNYNEINLQEMCERLNTGQNSNQNYIKTILNNSIYHQKNIEFSKFIEFLMTSFPHVEMMRRAIPLQNILIDCRGYIANIQNTNMQLVEKIFLPNRDFSESSEEYEELIAKHGYCDKAINQVMSVLKHLEKVKNVTVFFDCYDNFHLKFPAPLANIIYRHDSLITANLVDHFPKFTKSLIYILVSNKHKPEVSLSLLKEWILFIRSVTINEELDRSASFDKLVREIPFIDLSYMMRKSIINMQIIDSLVLNYLNNPSNFVLPETKKKYIDSSTLFQKLLAKLIVTVKFTNINYDASSQSLLSIIFLISSSLHDQVQRYWKSIVEMFHYYDKFLRLVILTHNVRGDLSLDRMDFPLPEYSYLNFIMSINITLKKIISSNHISSVLYNSSMKYIKMVDKIKSEIVYLYSEKIKIKNNFKFLLKIQDIKRALLTCDISVFINKVNSLLAMIIPIVFSKNIKSPSFTENIIYRIKELLDDLENKHTRQDYLILIDLKKQINLLKEVNGYDNILDPYAQISTLVKSELNIALIKFQIAFSDIFLTHILQESPKLIAVFANGDPIFEINDIQSTFYDIPNILLKFDQIKAKLTKKNLNVNELDLNSLNSLNNLNTEMNPEEEELVNNFLMSLEVVKKEGEKRYQEIISASKEIVTEDGILGNIRSYEAICANYQEKYTALQKLKVQLLHQNEKRRELLLQAQNNMNVLKQRNALLENEILKLKDENTLKQSLNVSISRKLIQLENIKSDLPVKQRLRPKPVDSLAPVLPVFIDKEKSNEENNKTNKRILDIESRYRTAIDKNKRIWEKIRKMCKNDSSLQNKFFGKIAATEKKNHEPIPESIIQNFNDIKSSIFTRFDRLRSLEQAASNEDEIHKIDEEATMSKYIEATNDIVVKIMNLVQIHSAVEQRCHISKQIAENLSTSTNMSRIDEIFANENLH